MLTFAPGSTRVLATVATSQDNILESDESFDGLLRVPRPLGRVSLGTITQSQGIIENDDGMFSS